ncbi:MAG: hypothetical protein J0I06_07435 [Planctomycetes bacterium]|nr:hypothetical protein [Planctomycetota bacterium]
MNVSGVGADYTSLAITIQQSGLAQGVGVVATGNDPDGDGDVHSVGSPAGDSARISGPGQLFSQLQQLQSQDPTKFKQVTADIATQLQTAAQQATGHQATFLTNLADKFQTASTTGDVSALRPPHHGHHAHATYNAQGQVAPTTPTSDTGGASATGGTGTDLGQLLSNIAKEVASAVGA